MQDNPYLPLVEKEAEQGVRASMLTAIDKQPDTEAKLQDLARRYNMPVEAVRLNQPAVQRRAAFEAVDYETLAREMPSTSAWLSTPENAAIAHDNVDNMGAIERKLRQFGGGLGEAFGMSASGTGVLADVLQRTAINDFASIFLPEPKRGPMGLEPQKPTIESLAGPLIGEGWREAGGAVKSYARQNVAGVGEKTFTDQVAGGLGQVVGQVAMLPFTRGAGLYAQGADVMNEKVAGDPVDQRTKDLAVLGGAAVTGVTEAWALDKLLGPLAVPVKNQVGAALARIGIAAAAEGGQEFSENVLQDTIRKALTNQDAEINLGQSVEEGGVGAAVGGVVRVIVESALHVRSRGDRKAQQAEQGAQTVAELSELAKADKVLQRNPDAFAQFIRQAAEDGPVPTVYIDAQALMQSGVAEQVANVSASVAEQIQTAVATGGQIAIPVEEFTAKIAPTDFAQSLIDHIRTEPDGFTRAEAQQYRESVGDQLQQEVERTLAEKQGDAVFQQSQGAVKSTIQQELDALGRFDPAKNEADATLFASYYAVRAAQLGVMPEALFEQRRVRFAAEAVAGQQFQQVAIDTPEFSNWFGDSKVVDSAGKPLVVYHGTQEDFTSFDPNRTGSATDDGDFGAGFYFTTNQEVASAYAGEQAGSNVVPVVLSMQNPLVVKSMTEIDLPGFWGAREAGDSQRAAQAIQAAGYDGVIETGGAYPQYVAFRPEQIKSATGNRGTFDPNDPNILNQQARGAFSPESLTITLLKGADLSTALHEGAHFFFENDIALAAELVGKDPGAVSEGERQIMADVSALMRWHGIEGTVQEQLATWYGLDFEAKRAAHERTAESFEAYLFNGKAPSLELAPYFQKFRAWLLSVYKGIKQFLSQNPEAGKLDDTVRQVFDRMLASSEQIKLAEQGRSMFPLFATPEEAGMTVYEFAAYQASSTDATADAIDDLQARGLRDMQWLRNARGRELKRLQKEAAALRAETRIDARREIMGQPVYRAWQFLTSEAVEGGEPAGKLDAAALQGIGFSTEETRRLRDFKMVRAEGGLHPDVVAELFGLGSGDEMVRALAAAEKPGEAIEALTDRLMMERHGELSTPEAIERAADAAIHNAARARMIATEANALAQASGERKVLLSAAREFSRNVVARLKVRDLRPSQYSNAAARAAANAARASKAGDVATAAAEKRNQLVQTLAAKEANDARTEVDGLRRAWSELANRSDDKLKKTYDMDLVNAVRAILANVGIAEAKGKRAAEYLDKLLQYDPAMHAVIVQSVTAAESMGKPFRDMTVEEVRGLGDEIEAILHLARRSRQMEVAGNLLDREEIEAELQVRMAEIGVPENIPGRGSAITPAEARMAKFKTLIAAGRRVESWVGAMDGSAQMGPFRKYIFGVVKDAADSYRADKAKYLKQFRSLFDAVAPTLKPQLIHSPELGYTFGKDAGGSAVNEILHAILHTGNASNKRKLLLGRGWASETDSGELDTSRWDAFINRMAAEGKLKKEHFDFAQGVWDMLDGIKPLAQKTHRDVFGKYFDEITAEPVQTPFGVYAGGYVPAMADSRVVTDAKLRKLQEDENAGMSYAFPTTPTGFTKARVEYNRPLLLDLRTLAQHIDKVLLFSHMTGPVRDVQKVLTSIGGTLDKMDQGVIEGMLLPWLNRSARQQVTTPLTADGGVSRFFSVLRSRAGMAAMFANVVNTAQQITGFSIAAVKVKPRLMLSAAADMAKGPKAFVRAVTEASPYMAGRLDNDVAAMSDQINDILLNPSMLQQAERWTSQHAYFLQSAVDSWMSPIVWKGAYDQAMENGATHEEAVKLGDSAVRETQGSSLPEDVSRFETGNAFVRLFTQFAGYFNMQANLMGTEFVKVARDMGLKNGAGRGLYVLFLGFLAPAVVSELIVQAARGGPEDEDDDGYLDDWLAALFVYAPMRNATAMVPGVGQGINAVVNATNGKPYDDRLATSPAISMLETAARAPYSAYRAVVEEGSGQKAVRDVATLISLSIGLPASAVSRPVGYLAGVEEGRIEPSGPVDMTRGLITGSRGQP